MKPSFELNLEDGNGMILESDWSLWVNLYGDHCKILFRQKIILVLQVFGQSMRWLCCTERNCEVCVVATIRDNYKKSGS